MRPVFIAAFLFFVLSARSQDTAYARQAIKKLTSEKFYGRGYLKDGLEKAANYISSELKSIGAKPLFASGYFQPFTFNVNTFPGKVTVKVDGKLLVPGADYILSPESKGLKGKFIMQKRDSVTYLQKPDQQKSEYELETKPVIELKKKLTFSVARKTDPFCIVELLQKGNEYSDIKTLELDVENKLCPNFKNNNVCAYVDGTVNNDTIIIYSAHYDHLGGMGKKTFFPGANDNASGVSVVLNLAKYYAKNPPKYKTLFVFFAGEEAGLIGSKYFVENKTVDLAKIKFLVNLDLLGTGDDGIMVVNGAVYTKQFDLLNTINAEKKLVKEIKKRGKAQNSDHYWFTEAGVPAFFIYTLGGTVSYHDIYDVEKQLPLTDYIDVCKLITEFVSRL